MLIEEYYGTARSSENYAALCTGKVWGGVGSGVVVSVLIAVIGWSSAFLLGVVSLTVVGVLMLRRRPVERSTG